MARYVVALLAINALALATMAVNPWTTAAGVYSDAADKGTPIEAPQKQPVPKSWGRLAGVTVDKWLVFEGSDGTVRLVDYLGRLRVEIKRN